MKISLKTTKKPKRAAETEKVQAVPLVQELFSGPIDIIGDIHGEYGALLSLLDRLGYDGHGNHPEERRLVFVGDLIDRGPDSISVVKFVKSLCERNKAQCILGNHEFNVLNGKRKHGNLWFYGETEAICKGSDAISFQKLADDSTRKELLDFFNTLPVALERKDVRVVHAAWKDDMIDIVREFKGTVCELNALYKKKLDEKIKKEDITDSEEISLIHQNENPLKVCTSGLEKKVKEKFFAGGKWRTVDRCEWWNEISPSHSDISSNPITVIGHYWRRNMEKVSDKLYDIHPNGFEPTGRDLFKDYDLFALLGPAKSVMCVDYAAGIRYEERGMGLPEGSMGTSLGALRLPERLIILDDGTDSRCT